METVSVDLKERSYRILVGSGLLEEIGDLLVDVLPAGRVAVVTDSDVGRIYADRVQQRLQSHGFETGKLEVAPGEASKSLEMAERLFNGFLDLDMGRRSAVVALGGGVVGDLAGFAAATFMRGITYVQVPTSLLAQIDSSVGGKVAVNLKRGKNLVGAFHQPRAVIADVSTLSTLPRGELVSGMAEVVKHGMIMDAELFEFVEEHCEDLLGLLPDVMSKVVAWNCRLKAEVVEKDEEEAGLRAILNFGHTLGHALESVCKYAGLKHVEAVAVGMVFACRLAIRLGKCGDETLERLKCLLEKIGLPTQLPGGVRARDIIETMRRDKKARAGKLRWVLPNEIGDVQIGCEVADEMVEELLGGGDA